MSSGYSYNIFKYLSNDINLLPETQLLFNQNKTGRFMYFILSKKVNINIIK